MTARKKTMALWIALAALLTLLIPSGFALAEDVKPSEIVAERTSFSQLSPGDRFLVVNESASVALSMNTGRSGIYVANVTLAHTDSREVLTSIAPDAAVFEIEPDDDGGIRLKCQSGYLSAPETGDIAYYSPEPGPDNGDRRSVSLLPRRHHGIPR